MSANAIAMKPCSARQPARRLCARNCAGLRGLCRVAAGVRIGDRRFRSEEENSGDHDLARLAPRDARRESDARRRAFAAILIPFAIGILRAQTLPPAPKYTYEVVSIHKTGDEGCPPCGLGIGPEGGLRISNYSVIRMLEYAYSVRDYQILGAPGWVSSATYDIVFTPEKAETPLGPDPALSTKMALQNRNKQRLQAVLRDRFGLVLRAETHELPVYLLTQAKSGAKLTVHPEGEPGHGYRMNDSGYRHMEAVGITMKTLADSLSRILGRPVNDGSGLTGQYDFKLEWAPDPGSSPEHPDDPTGPSIFTALAEQLGLRVDIDQRSCAGVRNREGRTSERELSNHEPDLNHLWQSGALLPRGRRF